jgi:DNA repair exonuclease SbcCD nuclease subunit
MSNARPTRLNLRRKIKRARRIKTEVKLTEEIKKAKKEALIRAQNRIKAIVGLAKWQQEYDHSSISQPAIPSTNILDEGDAEDWGPEDHKHYQDWHNRSVRNIEPREETEDSLQEQMEQYGEKRFYQMYPYLLKKNRRP